MHAGTWSILTNFRCSKFLVRSVKLVTSWLLLLGEGRNWQYGKLFSSACFWSSVAFANGDKPVIWILCGHNSGWLKIYMLDLWIQYHSMSINDLLAVNSNYCAATSQCDRICTTVASKFRQCSMRRFDAPHNVTSPDGWCWYTLWYVLLLLLLLLLLVLLLLLLLLLEQLLLSQALMHGRHLWTLLQAHANINRVRAVCIQLLLKHHSLLLLLLLLECTLEWCG